jgi:hypothetical protein
VGGSTHQAGGIPVVMTGAKIAAENLLRDLG